MSNEVEAKVDASEAVSGVAEASESEERAAATTQNTASEPPAETNGVDSNLDDTSAGEVDAEMEAAGTDEETETEASIEPPTTDEQPKDTTTESSTEDATADDTSEQEQAAEVLTLDQVETGKVYEGIVRNIQPYGAFVDIGAQSDGLVHISELRDGYVEKVEDVVSVNQRVNVRVKEVDAGRGRISLTMREPGKKKQKKLSLRDVKEGKEYEGVVTSIVDFGAFVDIGATTDGLVHISELSDERVNKVSDVVSTGEEVTVRVLNVDRRRKRISLSMRPPQETEYTEYQEEEEATPTLIELAFARAAERAGAKDERREQKDTNDTSGMSDIIRRTIEQHEADS